SLKTPITVSNSSVALSILACTPVAFFNFEVLQEDFMIATVSVASFDSSVKSRTSMLRARAFSKRDNLFLTRWLLLKQRCRSSELILPDVYFFEHASRHFLASSRFCFSSSIESSIVSICFAILSWTFPITVEKLLFFFSFFFRKKKSLWEREE